MQPAFPAELGNELGPDVLMIWSFLHSFSNILGLRPASVDEVLTAVALGERRWVLVPLQCCSEMTLQESILGLHASRFSCLHFGGYIVAASSGDACCGRADIFLVWAQHTKM